MNQPKRRKLRALLSLLIATRLAALRAVFVRKPSHDTATKFAPPPLCAPILKALNHALGQGHTCLPLAEIIDRLQYQRVGCNRADLLLAVRHLSARGQVWLSGELVALPQCARAEASIVRSLKLIGRRLSALRSRRLEKWLKIKASDLTDEQRNAIRLLVKTPISLLTGDPGTGKTSTIKAVAEILAKVGYNIHLTAPTGRAAFRLAEATGTPAQTLHRLLHARGNWRLSWRATLFSRLREVIIVDEASMLDLFLAERLLNTCTARTRLILVGDVNQLPPVGPGQVLRDLIASGQLPVAVLTKGLRQADESRIAEAACRIKAGRMPTLPAPGSEPSDCYFIEAATAPEIQRLVVKAAAQSLPARCGADPLRDIQVLTPMRLGPLGTVTLNGLLQRALNPNIEGKTEGLSEQVFLPGDRVLHTRNNYQLGVCNGETGRVEEVTKDKVTVSFGTRRIVYNEAALPDLTHGYAITIHRAQGSEYPFVIIPVHESQGVMLTRALVYTALTRGKQMVVFIGSRQALARAISNDESSRRLTGLAGLLATNSEAGKKAA